MTRSLRSALAMTTACAVLAAGVLLAPRPASASHGIKCDWVLVSSINGVNTYAFVCSTKGP